MSFKFLDAVTSTGVSAAKPFKRLVKDHSVEVLITGAPTAVTVDLEGSLDGTNFFQLDTHAFTAGELTAAQALFHTTDKTVRSIRLNLVTLTGGSSPTVTGLYEGIERRN